MKYDDASWHYGGDFPDELPPEAGATHIGMFVAWAVLQGLAGQDLVEDSGEDIDRLKSRLVTPVAWFIAACDEKFIDEDLNEEGNAFAASYYVERAYADDYLATFPEYKTEYHVADSWENYERLAPIIQSRYEAWRRRRALTGLLTRIGRSIGWRRD